jgi:3-phosphoshikimate 1-carboxyvinyltransferase
MLGRLTEVIKMDVKIYPGKLKGEMTPPPSKSYLHRAIICASLAKGKSIIKNILIGEDIQQTIEAFRSLGVSIKYIDNQLIIESSGQFHFKDNHPIKCQESGSTIRFLMPLLTNHNGVEFYGENSLLNRPLDLYEQIFSKQSIDFVRFENYIYTQGQLQADDYVITDDSSSQYISGLLFALPLLDKDSSIKIKENFQSRKYIDMTIHILSHFNIKIIKKSPYHFIIPGKQTYQAKDINIEADFSQAAFLMVGAALNGHIHFNNLNINSLQPDKEIIHILKKAGVKMTYKNDQLIIYKSPININEINLAQMIDLGPILMMLASQSQTNTQFTHFERLAIKESNRLKNMLNILDEMDVFYEHNNEMLTIGFQDDFHFIEMDSFNDHRIAMSLAVMASLAQTPTIIKHMEVINKSYPTFLHDLEKLGLQVKYLS